MRPHYAWGWWVLVAARHSVETLRGELKLWGQSVLEDWGQSVLEDWGQSVLEDWWLGFW